VPNLGDLSPSSDPESILSDALFRSSGLRNITGRQSNPAQMK